MQSPRLTASQVRASTVGLPPRMHPLAMMGYKRYFNGAKKFEQEDLDELRQGLIQLTHDPHGMWAALSSLGVLAMLIEQEGDSDSGKELRSLISLGGQHLAPIAGQIANALGIKVAAPADRDREAHAKWLALSTNHRAPVFGDKAPAHTRRLYEVDFSLVTSRFREIRLVRGSQWRPKFV